ncbi:LacI family transcriptional regulator [Streptomyces bathyalis]|uniref:LacI family transcriptional regulator n=1 Tax=Streptomyces bathyalis TaxID=2710756 RepID=A0A7T1T2Q1_9ACTN|nr:LacI family DNA-binding transcriptional regulator [Streptomyces bathyalis]QPP05315.1 LacI family transcriptional regulator [Streptomyces bathyalis]
MLRTAKWRDGQGMTTIKDVAAAAGVSPSTVSRVLNNGPKVDPALARRVRKAAAQLDYRPSRVAQSLRRQRSHVWMLLVPDVRNPFFTDMVRGVEDAARGAGYALTLCNTDDDVAQERRYLELALNERVSGVILSPASDTRSAVEHLTAKGIPVVTVDRVLEHDSVDAVLVDNRDGARKATGHLLEAGYRNLACITGPEGQTTAADRLAGFRDAHTDCGVKLRPELIRHGDFRISGGEKAADELLRSPEPPDAVFVANNLMTLGTLDAITAAGLNIPSDIAIVGWDDAPWAPLLRPALTTVAQPTHELGQQTAALLESRIAGSTAPQRIITLRTHLNVRASSTPASALPLPRTGNV